MTRPETADQPLRLPQVDKILRQPTIEALATKIRREIITVVVREELARLRRKALKAQSAAEEISAETVARSVVSYFDTLLDSGLKRVINGTGVILSTNLGRAPLSPEAVQKLTDSISSYCNLEFDLAEGERGERTEHFSNLLRLLTGAPASIVVNNCAAAVMLAVQTLARDKEVIVSRGELIEIGGSFRLPDVIAAAGGLLKEVGTTNRTRLSDYKNAITEKTGLIIKCHRSNFQITGFTEEVEMAELAALAKESNIPLVYDLGGGCFVDLAQYDLAPEPTVQATLAHAGGLVLFSGDKLLGGPQAGIIAGEEQYVQKLRQYPVYRALRADKVVLALLEIALNQYLYVDGAARLPVFQLAAQKAEAIENRVNLFIDRVQNNCPALQLSACKTVSTVGGGSLPGERLESHGLSIKALHKNVSENKLAAKLRAARPPVISTINAGLVMLDFRTIKPDEETDLERIFKEVSEHITEAD